MADQAQRQLVWDVPTRIFHWLLVGLIAFSWWSAENYRLDLHLYSGIAVLALVVFRILWGFFGTSTSRFGQFIKGPAAIRSYLSASSGEVYPVGHNPLGGWSVAFMLLVLAVQVGSGLFAVDVDGIESGPLSYLVDFDQGRQAAGIHEISFNLLLVVIALHVLAVIFYLLVRRRNLIGPMVTGSRRITGDTAAEAAVLVPRWRLLLAVVIAAIFAYWVFNGLQF